MEKDFARIANDSTNERAVELNAFLVAHVWSSARKYMNESSNERNKSTKDKNDVEKYFYFHEKMKETMNWAVVVRGRTTPNRPIAKENSIDFLSDSGCDNACMRTRKSIEDELKTKWQWERLCWRQSGKRQNAIRKWNFSSSTVHQMPDSRKSDKREREENEIVENKCIFELTVYCRRWHDSALNKRLKQQQTRNGKRNDKKRWTRSMTQNKERTRNCKKKEILTTFLFEENCFIAHCTNDMPNMSEQISIEQQKKKIIVVLVPIERITVNSHHTNCKFIFEFHAQTH